MREAAPIVRPLVPVAAAAEPGALRYAGALAIVGAVLGVRLALGPLLSPEPAFLFFPLTVFLIGWWLGLGPGLLATAAATLAGWLFFLDPGLAPRQRIAHTAIFLAQAAATCAAAWYLERLHHARTRADGDLRQANLRATALLDNIGDAFYTVDADWRFTYFNHHFRRYFRAPAAEMIGEALWAAFPEYLDSVCEVELRRVMTERVAAQFEAPSRLSERWFLINAYPLGDGIGVFATDTTERHRIEAEMRQAKEEAERQSLQLQEARAQAEAASRMKDQFLATLSHELRTPLNSIFGWVQILQSGRLDEAAVRRGLATIERSSRAQAQLIDDLLDVSRIISGNLRLDLRPVDLPEILDAALATIAPAAEAKGIRIEKSFLPLPGSVSGDPGRLQQVVWNLLSNAVKFTPRGGRVEIDLRPGEDAQVEIRVADNGQGIHPDFIPFVFDPFRQADPSTTRRQGGLGLGLSIVRQMVEMHGGTVWVESAGEGAGAAFTVFLPRAAAATGDALREKPAPAVSRTPASLAGVRVLVVDDDPEARELLRQTLIDRGAREVMTAGSAADALGRIATDRPDVLVSDIAMPVRDGYDLIRDVRARWPALPAIALTAFARAEDRRHAFDAGFQAHLVKPFDAAELAETVARLAGQDER